MKHKFNVPSSISSNIVFILLLLLFLLQFIPFHLLLYSAPELNQVTPHRYLQTPPLKIYTITHFPMLLILLLTRCAEPTLQILVQSLIIVLYSVTHLCSTSYPYSAQVQGHYRQVRVVCWVVSQSVSYFLTIFHILTFLFFIFIFNSSFYLSLTDTQGLEKERNFVSEILTFIFGMERVLLQPANSLLQPAKKVRI